MELRFGFCRLFKQPLDLTFLIYTIQITTAIPLYGCENKATCETFGVKYGIINE
jgi:hypothetical protein